ncbi:metal dependent phosphohydrolase [Candidatus Scalindua japonica]|uniref:Metal dependent phosphohydrolase n=2 Tax=Candidatus Scalindua japonica TaxID=1284222 RepID=A0A286TYZ6_9BACT|nr:metal dependent phosphohydrolase [Candidatus Scalindua japonica]
MALRVIEVTADPKSSANDLMAIISPDVSLTTKILKIANSPFYGLTREISSLQHAVTVLGFKEIRNLVISTVAFDSFKNIKQGGRFDINKFWKHSFYCALAAKAIAVDLKIKSNELFVAGLVHDIGKLAMFITFPSEFMMQLEIMSPLKIKYTAFEGEKDVFGMTHDEVGMRLLKKWMFPESLINAVGYHHHPQEADNKSHFPIIVHVADILTHIHEMQEEDEEGEYTNTELFYGDAIELAQSFGIDWNLLDLSRLQQTLKENIKNEAETIKLFF